MSLGKLVGTAVVGTALVVGATGCAEDVFRIGTVTRNSFQIPSTNSHCKRYAFEMKGDFEDTARAMDLIADQEVGYIAVSLGLPHTLFDHPAGMTHFFVPQEKRLEKGISDTLIRLSVGLEDPERIILTLKNILEYTEKEL